MSARMSSARPMSALQHAREVGRGLQAGGGIEFAADRLDLLGDVAGAAPLGALEGHMLQQVRDAVLGSPSRGGRRRRPTRRATPSRDAACGGRPRAGRSAAGSVACSCARLPVLGRGARSATKRLNGGQIVGQARRCAPGRVISEARRGGRAGRSPVIACMASGNLAGWAVASTMFGTVPVGRSSSCAPRRRRRRVCGSSR